MSYVAYKRIYTTFEFETYYLVGILCKFWQVFGPACNAPQLAKAHNFALQASLCACVHQCLGIILYTYIYIGNTCARHVPSC